MGTVPSSARSGASPRRDVPPLRGTFRFPAFPLHPLCKNGTALRAAWGCGLGGWRGACRTRRTSSSCQCGKRCGAGAAQRPGARGGRGPAFSRHQQQQQKMEMLLLFGCPASLIVICVNDKDANKEVKSPLNFTYTLPPPPALNTRRRLSTHGLATERRDASCRAQRFVTLAPLTQSSPARFTDTDWRAEVLNGFLRPQHLRVSLPGGPTGVCPAPSIAW